MYKFTNLSQKYNRLSVSGQYFTNLQLLNLAKHDIYPHFSNYIKTNKRTNILINSGKVLINFKKEIKKENRNSNVNEKTNNYIKTLFAEPNILCENNEDANNDYTNNVSINYDYTNFNDTVNVLTNRSYILTVFPNVYFSFYSYNKNSSLILLE